MDKFVIEEILQECKWYDKIVIKVFKKVFIRVYHIGRVNTINIMLK